MTNFNFKNMIVLGMAVVCSVFNANAQNDSIQAFEVSGDAVAAAASSMVAKGCYESAIIEGIVTAENCYGWQFSGGIGTEVLNWNSEQGSGTTTSVGGILNLGYRSGHWQPNAKVFIGSPMKVEGQSFTDMSASFNVRYNLNKHDHTFGKDARPFNFYVEGTAGCRWIKSIDKIYLGEEWNDFENPFNAPYIYFGGNIGGEWIIKSINHYGEHITADGIKMKTREVSHLKLGFSVGVDYGQVNKLRQGETQNTLKAFTLKGEVKLTYDL